MQVLCSPSSSRKKLQEEEMRPYKPTPTQEEAQVNDCRWILRKDCILHVFALSMRLMSINLLLLEEAFCFFLEISIFLIARRV